MKDLIKKLNDLKITQTGRYWEDSIPDDFYKEYLDGTYGEVDFDLNIEKHRWYETSVTVLEFPEGLIGVRSITGMFSEGQDYEDCNHTLEFFEMEQYTLTSYRKCSK